jgi:hypothetical protein
MSQVSGKSIAQQVFEQYQASGVVAVPDGEFAAAVSHPEASDSADPRRSLHLIFADGSDVGIHDPTLITFTKAGETDVDQRCEAALKIAPELDEFNGDAAVAAIKFALNNDDGMGFLQYWNQGDFDVCRSEWPEAPDEVYIGADPLHVPSNK